MSAPPQTSFAAGPPIAFQDLRPSTAGIAAEIATAVERVLASGWYILGQELTAFEGAFAKACGVAYCVGVGNGTDAIALALQASGVVPGDEVITTPHTALATLCAITQIGAIPVLADIESGTATLDPECVAEAITPRTRALVPVHLYGQAADLHAFKSIATAHGLRLIEDCAQAHGAKITGQSVGSVGDAGAFSFYPTKNLGAYGDAGAVVTNDAAVAERVRLLRNYGQTDRYHHAMPGINSRLDELQAAILMVKLQHLTEWTARRQALAARYTAHLAELAPRLRVPVVRSGAEHVFHLYVVQTAQRDALRSFLAERGIETLIHYPIPAHLQPAYAHLGLSAGSLPVAERVADEVLSLPLYPELSEAQVDRVCATVREFFRNN